MTCADSSTKPKEEETNVTYHVSCVTCHLKPACGCHVIVFKHTLWHIRVADTSNYPYRTAPESKKKKKKKWLEKQHTRLVTLNALTPRAVMM